MSIKKTPSDQVFHFLTKGKAQLFSLRKILFIKKAHEALFIDYLRNLEFIFPFITIVSVQKSTQFVVLQ